MKATPLQSFSWRQLGPRISALIALVAAFASHAQTPPRPNGPGGPPTAAERAARGGPWDQDIVVYRVPQSGRPELLTKFERAGVATAARLGDGRLAIAHQHFPASNEADFDKVAVHFSRDEGASWSAAEVIRLRGLSEGMRFPFDPTLVPLADGRVRLYFTSVQRGRGDNVPAIYSAISSDAVEFTVEPGMRFGINGRAVIDCAVALHRGEFHLFAPDNGVGHPADPGRDQRPISEQAREGIGYHAVSKDGLKFERVADVQINGRRRWLGDAKSDGEKITFYGTGEGGVWTATSSDGKEWTLGRPISDAPAADPGTAGLKDGALLLAGTGPPRPGTPGALRRPPNRNADDPPRKNVGADR
jgi:hypothetical protein